MNGKFLTGKIKGGVCDENLFAANKLFLIFSIKFIVSKKRYKFFCKVIDQ